MAAGTSHTTISIKLNEQGFHDIFNKYYVTLCLFANQYTENQETSADIVQDSFAKLWQIREDFFYLHQVKAFLYTVVRNKALNELEHSKVVYEYAQNVKENLLIPYLSLILILFYFHIWGKESIPDALIHRSNHFTLSTYLHFL